MKSLKVMPLHAHKIQSSKNITEDHTTQTVTWLSPDCDPTDTYTTQCSAPAPTLTSK